MAYFHTITPDDVGRPLLKAFGHQWPVSTFLGGVLAADVGKRVYLAVNDEGTGHYLQVENDEQRAARLGAERDALLAAQHAGLEALARAGLPGALQACPCAACRSHRAQDKAFREEADDAK